MVQVVQVLLDRQVALVHPTQKVKFDLKHNISVPKHIHENSYINKKAKLKFIILPIYNIYIYLI